MRFSLAAAFLPALAACATEPDIPPSLLSALQADDAGPQLLGDDHLGPPVAAGNSGPARFVTALLDAYDSERARAAVEFIDGFYRAPGNEGYDATLDRLAADLRAAGFGSGEGLELEFLESPVTSSSWNRGGGRVESPAWTPRRGSVVLASGGQERVLHEFSHPGDRDRTLLPINAPSCDVRGTVAFHIDELEPGQVLVIEAPLSRSLIQRAKRAGAEAVLSASYESFNVDPTGAERHQDFVQYRNLYYPPELPVGQISPRSYGAIRDAVAADPEAELAFQAEVSFEERPLRTLVATITGASKPLECVAVSSHVNEPGAGDNASGVGAMLEGALALAAGIDDGSLERPARSVVFIWGDEFRMTETWLAHTSLEPVAGISADMLGQSRERTGAIALVERAPDPGAVRPLEPDVHTPWGANPVDPDELEPNGLAIIARCAMIDVDRATGGGWKTADHPWEGGSDHDVYNRSGIPGILFWHFTDFSYHSNLDRLEMLDYDELERTSVAILATLLAVADPQPGDLDRYLASNNSERNVRVDAALGAEDEDLAEEWRAWSTGARHWLRKLCLE